tara:strand:- start:260 stop:508 length:249 start_codon:yes stop_codon:yes gene_type:complete
VLKGSGKSKEKKVSTIIEIVVKKTRSKLAPILRLEDEKTHGINKKIIKGFLTPPVKKSKILNCNISKIEKTNADLSDNSDLL